MALSFGVTSTGGYGVLQTVTRGSTAEKAEARDETGKVTDEIAYSRTSTAQADFVADTATAENAYAAGTSLTIGDLTGLITDVSVNETNADYKRGSVSIEKKDAATQVAYT